MNASSLKQKNIIFSPCIDIFFKPLSFAATYPYITGTVSVSGGLPKSAAPAHLTSQVKAQYNSPQALYSDENIREVLDQQSETLAGGVKG